MNNKDLIINEFKRLKNIDNFNISKLYCLERVERSLEWLNKKYSMNKKMEIAEIVYQYYLDTEIQITQISDIICEHWKEYLKDEDFDIYDYTEAY